MCMLCGGLKSSAAAAPAAVRKGRKGAEAKNARLRKRLAKTEVKLGQTRAALDIMGKAFAPVAALREHGFAGAVREVSKESFDLLEPVTGVKKACELTGESRATVYRRRSGIRSGCRERRPAAPNALSAAERGELTGPRTGQAYFHGQALKDRTGVPLRALLPLTERSL
jgi:hypothetical protein